VRLTCQFFIGYRIDKRKKSRNCEKDRSASEKDASYLNYIFNCSVLPLIKDVLLFKDLLLSTCGNYNNNNDHNHNHLYCTEDLLFSAILPFHKILLLLLQLLLPSYHYNHHDKHKQHLFLPPILPLLKAVLLFEDFLLRTNNIGQHQHRRYLHRRCNYL